MRMRGRRVALLLTGVLPLLAKDDVPASEANVTIADEDENDVEAVRIASEALHDDSLKRLPTLNIMSMTSNPRNVVMTAVDPVFDTDDVLDDVILDVVADEQASDTRTRETEEAEPITDKGDSVQREVNASGKQPETVPQDATSDTKDGASESSPDTNATEKSESPAVEDVEVDTAAENQTSEGEVESKDLETGEAQGESQPAGDEEDEDEAGERVQVDYASKSAGALILEKAQSMKGTSNLLNADNDKYAIVPCSEKKFVVVGLSEDILVKQVKLANYERYSSHLKDFQIMGSQTMGEWVDLGTYTAEPGNGEQTFELNEPSWARYLKFKFLTHYGSEHYCTYSQIKVHGSTMLQGFHEQWEDAQESLEEDEGTEEDAATEGSADGSEVATESTRAKAADEAGDTVQGSETADEGVGEANGDAVDSGHAGNTSETVPETDGENKETAGEESTVPASTSGSADDGSAVRKEANDASSDADQVSKDELSEKGACNETDPVKKRGSTGLAAASCSRKVANTALLSASIETASHGAVTARRSGPINELGTVAMRSVHTDIKDTITSAVKTVVFEASEAFGTVKEAPIVFDAAKELQQTLKTAVVMGGPKKEDKTKKSTETGSVNATVEDASQDSASNNQAAGEDPVGSQGRTVNESASVASDNSSGEHASESNHQGADGSKDSQTARVVGSETLDAPTGEEDDVKTRTDEGIGTSIQDKEGLASVFADLLERFPDASCMNELDYQDFKTKMIAARKGGTNGGSSSSGSAPSSGKIEPIFKTLTDEIKALQISHSVQEQYIKTLVSCYQRVMLEMVETLNRVETRQEKRLSDLEQAMEAMQSSSCAKIVAVVMSIVAIVMSIVAALITRVASFGTLGASFVYSALKARLANSDALGSMEENASFLFAGALMLSVLTMALRLSTVQRAKTEPNSVGKDDSHAPAVPHPKEMEEEEEIPTSRPEQESPTSPEQTSTTTNNLEMEHHERCVQYVASKIPQSESEREVHPPVITTVTPPLIEKRPLLHAEPALVPVE